MQEQENQQLNDLIRSSFENKSKGAPDTLWANLSAALDTTNPPLDETPLADPLDQKVKESFAALQKRAPGHVWSGINRQLNIERVWQGISQELDKPEILFRPSLRMAAAILLLLLSAVGTYLLWSPSATNGNFAHQTNTGSLSNIKGQAPADHAGVEMHPSAMAGLPVTFSDPDASSSSNEKALSATKATIKPPQATLQEQTEVSVEISASEVEASSPDQVLCQGKEGSAANQKAASTHPAPAAGTDFIESVGVAQSLIPKTDEATLTSTKSLGAEPSESNQTMGQYLFDSGAEAIEEKPRIGAVASVADHDHMSSEKASVADAVPVSIKRLPMMLVLNKGLIDVQVMPLETGIEKETSHAELVEEKKQEYLRRNRFEAGPVLVYHNSWLLNNETKNSYNKNSLIATDPTYKQNWGVVLNYRLGQNSLLATEMHLVGRVGQQYKMYQQGEYLRKELELRYYKLYLQYQQNFLRWGQHVPNWLTAKAGVYGGYLESKQGEIRLQEHSQYDRFDYGLRLAVGQETRLGGLIIGYGFSAERGLHNVFRGTERLPSEFNKTYILNFGSYLNLRYSF
ncbi:PorT family protein [Cesiribacter sp. SM1]|uniref:PorT family protein n=1 Tax=Cesiribacter sp. SM1 TaxID=2861196 RepID=UPI001CD1D059|nr:PorT family protein [Cesiribacter sp. SM1]